MSYRTSYIIQEMARGRPAPTGSPDPKLQRAVANLSPPDIEAAIHQGARVSMRDAQGRTTLHALFDQAITTNGELKTTMERFIACCRTLMRENADVTAIHPVTGQSVLYRTAALAAHPQAGSWFYFWQQMRRGDMRAPGGRGLPSTLAAWHEKTGAETRPYLPALPKEALAKPGGTEENPKLSGEEPRRPKP